jgi:hypothetical protein
MWQLGPKPSIRKPDLSGLGSNCWLESLVALASFRPSHEYCESDGMVLSLTNMRGTILSCLASLVDGKLRATPG